jgi:methionyl-tRNA synthetase
MDRLRGALRLPPDVFRLDELGKLIPAGHDLGPNQKYFPGDARASSETDPPLSTPL